MADKKLEKVNHPAHYHPGDYEVIKVLKVWLTPEEYRGWIKGSMIKYLARERLKGGTEDIEKTDFYAKDLIEFDKKQSGD